jgi:hypothetical protein
MLDPLTAVSLATSIVQFVDFSSKVIAKTAEIYRDKSTSHILSSGLDAGLATRNLILVTNHIREYARPIEEKLTASTEKEAALLELTHRCEQLGKELIGIFQRLEETVSSRRGRKATHLWLNLGNAIRTVWNEPIIEEMKTRLESMRGQLHLHVSAEILWVPNLNSAGIPGTMN